MKSIFSLNSSNITDYFKFKNKHQYFFTDSEFRSFKTEVQDFIAASAEFNRIVVPQTTNSLFLEIVHEMSEVLIIPKRSKEEVLGYLDSQQMMKAERKKLYTNIQSMDEIKIHLIAGNQRSRVAGVLFEVPELDYSRDLFIDDAIFSGSTFRALTESIKPKEAIAIFLYEGTEI